MPQYTFMYRTYNARGEFSAVFLDDTGRERLYDAKHRAIKRLRLSCGGQYEVESVDDSHVRFVKDFPTGTIEDEQLRTQWRALDYAATKQQEIAKGATDDPLLKSLDPLRLAMQRMNAPQRAIMLARIAQYLTT